MTHLRDIEALQAIFDAIPNPVLVKDRDHRFVMLNSSALELFGHTRKILLPCLDTELFRPAEVNSYHEADDKVFASGVDLETEETMTDAEGDIKSVIAQAADQAPRARPPRGGHHRHHRAT